jgi:hypothetical protein
MLKKFAILIASAAILGNVLKADEVSEILNSIRKKPVVPESNAEAGNVVAKVNGENITQNQLDVLFNAALKESGAKRSDLDEGQKLAGYNQILQDLIMDKLVALASDNEIVADSDVDAEFAKIKNKFPDEKAFREQLRQDGMPLDKLRETIRTGLKQSKWLKSQVPLPDVTEEQAKAYYDSNISEFKQPGSSPVPFSEVKEQIITYLQGVTRREAVQGVLDKLKNSATIEIFLPKN